MTRRFSGLAVFGFTLAAAALLAPGCGGGGSSGSSSGSGSGTVTTTFADAPNDAIETFVVTVDQVTLEPGGVNLLAQPIAVDFAEAQGFRDLVAGGVAAGSTYTSVAITLDFTASGTTVVLAGETQPATVLFGTPDESEAAGVVTLHIDLDDDDPLSVVSGTAHSIDFDFDLASSLVVDAADNTVYVKPVLHGEADEGGAGRPDARQVRLRGPVSSTTATTFTLKVLPPSFSALTAFGFVTCDVTAGTLFDVSGTTALGFGGIALLSTATACEVWGHYDAATGLVRADLVEAGTVLAGATVDFTDGVILDMPGATTLDVRGFTVRRSPGSIRYAQAVTVTVVPGTTVVSALGEGRVDASKLAPGQRVVVAGALPAFVAGTRHYSVTADAIRILPVRTCANAGAIGLGSTITGVTVDRIAGITETAYTLNAPTAGGVNGNYTFDAAHANVAASLVAGADFRATGMYLDPTTAAGLGADFLATTGTAVVDLSGTTEFDAFWTRANAASTVLSSVSVGDLSVTLASATRTAIITGCASAGVPVGGTFQLLAPTGFGAFATRNERTGRTRVFLSFERWQVFVTTLTTAGLEVRRVSATGKLDVSGTSLTCRSAIVVLE